MPEYQDDQPARDQDLAPYHSELIRLREEMLHGRRDINADQTADGDEANGDSHYPVAPLIVQSEEDWSHFSDGPDLTIERQDSLFAPERLIPGTGLRAEAREVPGDPEHRPIWWSLGGRVNRDHLSPATDENTAGDSLDGESTEEWNPDPVDESLPCEIEDFLETGEESGDDEPSSNSDDNGDDDGCDSNDDNDENHSDDDGCNSNDGNAEDDSDKRPITNWPIEFMKTIGRTSLPPLELDKNGNPVLDKNGRARPRQRLPTYGKIANSNNQPTVSSPLRYEATKHILDSEAHSARLQCKHCNENFASIDRLRAHKELEHTPESARDPLLEYAQMD
ncbi:hypothetical protein QBC46DRAFT_408127 [Diplogelasinospora grovesii]|uniref:C2H2-type domain-containing protein n=1 Tax=Diplogelasinospora grovesii TaxID=303347 RepID=A0AAN6N8J4_9PEZI|nr:hypothetical protein QBC46DRAFT_408127 [Diplogelasinospora grovesii]